MKNEPEIVTGLPEITVEDSNNNNEGTNIKKNNIDTDTADTASFVSILPSLAYFSFRDIFSTMTIRVNHLSITKIIDYLFHSNNAFNGSSNTFKYYWDYVESEISPAEFFLRVKNFQIPPVTPNPLYLNIDWTFKDKATLVINSIINLKPADPFYYSKVIHLLNQACEYNKIFLTQNLSTLIENGIYNDAIINILNQNFEAF